MIRYCTKHKIELYCDACSLCDDEKLTHTLIPRAQLLTIDDEGLFNHVRMNSDGEMLVRCPDCHKKGKVRYD